MTLRIIIAVSLAVTGLTGLTSLTGCTDSAASVAASVSLSELGLEISNGGPAAVLERVRADEAACTSLRRATDAEARRTFLHAVAERAVELESNDLEALALVVDWESILLADLSPGRERLQALTEDLVLLFTERAPGGLLRSGSPFYRPGRHLDRGFAEAFRDDSDQVRHLSWALRLLATSDDLDKAMATLHAKEVLDSKRRQLPIEQADVELNRVARELIEDELARPDEDRLLVGLRAKLAAGR